MLALDSTVLDLIFEAAAELDPEALIAALGGEEVARARLLIDPDQQPPEFEMQVSPSVPLRRRGERRLMVIDDSVAPMRADPHADPVVPIDLREEKERLIAACEALPVRIGRLFALGSWGDAVIVTRRARDLRAVALQPWALDARVDVAGRRRATPLSEDEIKEKLYAFEKRLDELGEQDLLARLGPAALERRGELFVVSALEADGTWDLRTSEQLEQALAAVDRFSVIPGAPAGAIDEPSALPQRAAIEEPAKTAPGAAAVEGQPLRVDEVGGRLVLVFPRDRFNLDAAAALGTGAWDDILAPHDAVDRALRDRIHREGAGFIAPLEFLSEVFVEGKPLSRPAFEDHARDLGRGARALEVHCPRFGPALLVAVADGGRFLTSEIERAEAIVELLR
jgi:hypothetical protein